MAISKNWYESILKIDVEEDLEKHPEIKKQLGSYIGKRKIKLLLNISDGGKKYEFVFFTR